VGKLHRADFVRKRRLPDLPPHDPTRFRTSAASITAHPDRVHVELSEPTDFFAFTPNEARGWGEKLIEFAMTAELLGEDENA
jgi:hypothetical protein